MHLEAQPPRGAPLAWQQRQLLRSSDRAGNPVHGQVRDERDDDDDDRGEHLNGGGGKKGGRENKFLESILRASLETHHARALESERDPETAYAKDIVDCETVYCKTRVHAQDVDELAGRCFPSGGGSLTARSKREIEPNLLLISRIHVASTHRRERARSSFSCRRHAFFWDRGINYIGW